MVRCYAEEDGISLSVLCLICSLWYLHIVYTLTTPETATSKEAQLLNERRANSWVGPGNFARKKKKTKEAGGKYKQSLYSVWMMTKSLLTGNCSYSLGHMEETVKLIWT